MLSTRTFSGSHAPGTHLHACQPARSYACRAVALAALFTPSPSSLYALHQVEEVALRLPPLQLLLAQLRRQARRLQGSRKLSARRTKRSDS